MLQKLMIRSSLIHDPIIGQSESVAAIQVKENHTERRRINFRSDQGTRGGRFVKFYKGNG